MQDDPVLLRSAALYLEQGGTEGIEKFTDILSREIRIL